VSFALQLLDLIAQRRASSSETFMSIVNFIMLCIHDPNQPTGDTKDQNGLQDKSSCYTTCSEQFVDDAMNNLLQAFQKWLNSTSVLTTIKDDHWSFKDEDELKVMYIKSSAQYSTNHTTLKI
jgi:hypothetical protein